jgi:hypothetical protein
LSYFHKSRICFSPNLLLVDILIRFLIENHKTAIYLYRKAKQFHEKNNNK